MIRTSGVSKACRQDYAPRVVKLFPIAWAGIRMDTPTFEEL